MKVCYQVNNAIEDLKEHLVLFVLKDRFLANFDDVEHRVASSLLNFHIFVFEACNYSHHSLSQEEGWGVLLLGHHSVNGLLS